MEERDDLLDSVNANEDDMQKEARSLKQNTARMETRMRILSDHNAQLEAQLGRLRQLLVTDISEEKPSQADGNRNFGTLQSREIVAADLDSAGGVQERLDNRPNPPPSQQFTEMAGQVGKEIYELVTSLRKQQEEGGADDDGGEDNDSLGLSDHETQKVVD